MERINIDTDNWKRFVLRDRIYHPVGLTADIVLPIPNLHYITHNCKPNINLHAMQLDDRIVIIDEREISDDILHQNFYGDLSKYLSEKPPRVCGIRVFYTLGGSIEYIKIEPLERQLKEKVLEEYRKLFIIDIT